MKANTKKKQEKLDELLPLKSDTKSEKSSLTFVQKLKYAKSNITVEPVLGLFILSNTLAKLATQNLNLEKACRVNLGFNDSVCDDLRIRKRANHTFEEDEVQKLIASVQAWKSVLHTAVPAFILLFVGAWSDKTGRRKICMLMPLFGEIMTCILNIVNTYFFMEVPVEMTVFMEEIFPALMGGSYTITMATHSYIADITSKETRTFRMGILGMSMTAGFTIGTGSSGVLLRYSRYYGVFSASLCLKIINFCYVLFYLDDHRWLESKEKAKRKGCVGVIKEFFDIQSLKNTLGMVFKTGSRRRKLNICLVLFGVCLHYIQFTGEQSIMYIFTRYRFNWDEVNFSIYGSYKAVIHFVGTLFALSVFSGKLKWDDSVLGMISNCSMIMAALALAFAKTNVEAYLAKLLGALHATVIIALRSTASKLVTHEELGKVYALFGLAETTVPVVFVPVYSRVYISTLHVLPGAVFLLSAVIGVPIMAIFASRHNVKFGAYRWFYHEHRKELRDKREEEEIPTDTSFVRRCSVLHPDTLHSVF